MMTLRKCILNFSPLSKNRIIMRPISRNTRKTSKVVENTIDLDSPIKFSATSASKWKPIYETQSTRLWYEPYVVTASLAAFLLYFGWLREENDIDEELGRSLYSRIEGLEEHQLKASVEYNLDHGLPTEDLVARIKELQTESQSKPVDEDRN